MHAAEASPVVYRTPKGWRIFFRFLIPSLIGLGIFMTFFPWFSDEFKNDGVSWFISVTGLLLSLLMAYAMVSSAKYQVAAFPDRIEITRAFGLKVIRLEDFAGFRLTGSHGDDFVRFVPKSGKPGKGRGPRMSLAMANAEGFKTWLAEVSRNLDEADREKDLQDILADESLGSDPAERAAALGKAKRFEKILNGAALVLLLWSIFRPRPYDALIWILIVFPFIALAPARLFPGLVRWDGAKKGAHPTVAAPLFLVSIALALRAMLDWKILAWPHFWMPFAVATLALFGALVAQFKEVREQPGAIALALGLCAIFGYGAAVGLNGILDESRPQVFAAQVLDKRESHGKHTSYYLELSPWGPRTRPREVGASARMYRAARKKDSVGILVKEGALGIPWFYLKVRSGE